MRRRLRGLSEVRRRLSAPVASTEVESLARIVARSAGRPRFRKLPHTAAPVFMHRKQMVQVIWNIFKNSYRLQYNKITIPCKCVEE